MLHALLDNEMLMMARFLGLNTMPQALKIPPQTIYPFPTSAAFLAPAKAQWKVASMATGSFSSITASGARTKSKVEQVFKNVEWPEKFPFTVEDFQRFDESPDDDFYSEPRFVTHIDDPTIRALTKYYSEVFPPSNTPGVCLLDLCSSWVSHFPVGYKQDRIVGLGMNEEELKQNPVLIEYVVQDLNVNPKLPFEDNSCDVITNVVSVSYLTNPIDVFKEMQRVLKPGGLAIMSFSNRHFRKKAISLWKSTGDSDHVWIVGSYFHYAGGFEPPQVLKNVEWPENFPFKAEDFQHFDESPDTFFYSEPRFVTHIDDPAIRALTKYYSEAFPPSDTPGVCLLDLCSSWVSHFPAGYKQDRIVGMGMNEEELKRNPVLTEYVVQDLNVNPKLPFEDNSFDVITNVVSVDYLTKPMDVFKEMERILKPGGLAIISFSNRCFWTKAISIWTSTGDSDHVWIVGAYFHYAGGFEPPQAVDISPNPGRSDPMYIVYSRKVATA